MTPRNVVREALEGPALQLRGHHRTAVEREQQLRLRRFGFASIFSGLFVIVLMAFYLVGKLDRATLTQASTCVFSFILGFYLAFRTRVNLQSSDPSLTGWQFVAATATMLFVVYRAPDTRIVFGAFFFVAVMFGMLRRDSGKIAILGAIALVLYAALSWRRYVHTRDGDTLLLDLLQCLVMSVTFPWILTLQGHLQRLQKRLDVAPLRLPDVEKAARRDDLTGVYNRRAVVAAMHDAKQHADATGESFAICIIDIDGFERRNDEFDHLTGDRVLQTFARTVEAGMRSSDFFGRYGGAEFVHIMPRTSLAGALADAERLRGRVSTLELQLAPSLGALTVSIGVAQYEPKEDVEQTFARAGSALYRAKRQGRDRVAC
ncbi:MAG: GGDEF domain-containing protein [Burkholderiales bacterium]|nr:GGDEF domain-containing protein [Burkholderiales bacterium]